MRDLPIPDAFADASGQVKSHVRFSIGCTLEAIEPLAILDRDRWYQHDFEASSQGSRTISWRGIQQPWLRQWGKQWVWTRLAGNWAFTTAIANTCRLLPLSRYLAAEWPHVTGPQDLSRDLLLGYIAWTKRQPNIAASQRQGLVSTVRILIEDHRLNEWSPRIPETAVIRTGELPKRSELLPRPIEDAVLRQVLSRSNLRDHARPDLRTQLLIFDGHGLRIGTVATLQIDCLSEDADGFPTLRWTNTKRSRERLHPIRDPEVVTSIQEQQRRAREAHPDTPWLFPAIASNANGQRHITTNAIRAAFYDYLKRVQPTDGVGAPASVTPHQFRHTFGTRELNNGAPQEVVQELLDHDDPTMTRGYARLSGERLREQFVAAARFNATGQALESLLPDSPLADVTWMKERLNRARVTLPNGYCALPLQQTCEVQNACLDCHDYFVTTPDFLHAHEAQRERTKDLIREAEAVGHARVVEKNRTVLVKLDTLIASLRRAT